MLPMIIDSFAGGGGASAGIERALGRSPDVAINHNPDALALHEANHPETLHLSNDIWEVDPRQVAGSRSVGLLWASPDCKHFSKAKGGAPKDRNVRDLAWVIVRWAEQVKPDVILMENVEEFRTWGPLDDSGKVIEGLEGTIFDLWQERLRRAGYRTAWRELRACDYGAPTIRKRFFMVARRDGRRIVWPKPTHGDPKSQAVKRGKRLPWRTAAECIDWTLPCPSIFDTRDQIKARLGLTAVRPLADATMARIARGMARYVLEAEEPFLVNLTHGGRVEPAAEPFRTVTGANRGEKAAICPSIIRFNTGATGQDMRTPLSTVTANSYIKRPGGAAPLGLLTPFLPHLYTSNTAGGGGAADDPLKTVTAGGGHHAVVAPALIQIGYGEAPGQKPRALDLCAPLGTVFAGGVKHALTTATLAPWITYGQHGGASRCATDPLHTVTASSKDTNTVAAAYLAQHNTGVVGRRAGDPMGTIMGSGSQQNPVAAFFAKYYGTGDGAETGAPCHTVTVRDRFAHCQAQLAAPPFATHMHARAREVAEFLHAHGVWDGGEFVTMTIEGETYVVADIGMRMLTPRELFRAQGFPPDYVIEGVWEHDGDDWSFRPFTKSVQVSCVGNSVCPGLASALAAANCAHLAADADAVSEARA